MAEPQDSATMEFEDLTHGLRKQYHPGYLVQHARHGKKTNAVFNPTKRRLTGKQLEITVEHHLQAGARASKDLFSSLPTPRAYKGETYDVVIDETSASNHLTRIMTAIRTDIYSLRRARNNPEQKVDLIMRLRREAAADVAEHLARSRWLDSNATMATVDGDPVQNDAFFYADGSAHTNQTSVRLKIKDGSIAYFHDGQVVDVRDSGGGSFATNAEDLTVIDVNVADKSIALSGSADLAAITTGDTIHMSDEYGNGWTGMGQWFESGTTIFGVDRSNAGKRYMNCTRIDADNARLTIDLFQRAGEAAGYVHADNTPSYRVLSPPELLNDYIREVGESALLQMPTDASRVQARAGFNGALYVDPMLGPLELEADPFCTPGRVRMLIPEQWEFIWGYGQSFEWVPNPSGGIWHILPGSSRQTLFYEAYGLLLGCDICTYPRQQVEIFNIQQTR